MLDLDGCAVRIEDGSFVCYLHPLYAFLAMEDIVILALKAHKAVPFRLFVVYPDISDQSSAKLSVWIFPGVSGVQHHSAESSRHAEQREAPDLHQGAVVYILYELHIPSARLVIGVSVDDDGVVVFLCGPAFTGDGRQFLACLPCLLSPDTFCEAVLSEIYGTFRKLLLLDLTVKPDGIKRGGAGKYLSIAVKDFAAFRFYYSPFGLWSEILEGLSIRFPDVLQVYYASYCDQ